MLDYESGGGEVKVNEDHDVTPIAVPAETDCPKRRVLYFGGITTF